MSFQSVGEDPVRSRIRDAARQRFFELGPGRVTMDDLAGELGISKKTLYRHFRDKHTLLREALFSETDRVFSQVAAIVQDPSAGGVQKIAALVHFVGTEGPRPSRAFLNDILKTAPELWAELEHRRRQVLRDQFGTLFQQARREGHLRQDVHPDLLVPAVLALIDSLVNPRTLAELPLTAGQAIRELLRLVALGILSAEGREAFLRTDAAGVGPDSLTGHPGSRPGNEAER
jgi:AcrR family transcriptional regulator